MLARHPLGGGDLDETGISREFNIETAGRYPRHRERWPLPFQALHEPLPGIDMGLWTQRRGCSQS
jgi:hypothetical protein